MTSHQEHATDIDGGTIRTQEDKDIDVITSSARGLEELQDMLCDFMEQIEEISSEIEGSPTELDMHKIDAIYDTAIARIEVELTSQAKSYGGCTNCFGKGYATQSSRASGRGISWDTSGMKFCGCGRGQQLEQEIERELTKARIEGLTMAQYAVESTDEAFKRIGRMIETESATLNNQFKQSNLHESVGIKHGESHKQKGEDK